MQCPKCHVTYTEEDVYCRQCGLELTNTSTSIIPMPSFLPAVLYNSPLPRKVAASVGALALGFGLELLRRGLVARMAKPVVLSEPTLPLIEGFKDVLTPRNGKAIKPPKGYEVQETVVYMRRVIRRANQVKEL